MESTPNERREVRFSGWVQGVGFRFSVRRLAANFPVTGFVRNLADGRVELVAEGPSRLLDEFVGSIRAAFDRHIARVEETPCAATGEFRDFAIRH